MTIEYSTERPISADQFLHLLETSSLGQRRPIEDKTCIAGMINNSNLIVGAWDGDDLVGIARSVTDFHYACYLSDLAVASSHQRLGIGKKLMRVTQQQLGPRCKLILIAAPLANEYYAQFGFSHNERCWVLEPDQRI